MGAGGAWYGWLNGPGSWRVFQTSMLGGGGWGAIGAMGEGGGGGATGFGCGRPTGDGAVGIGAAPLGGTGWPDGSNGDPSCCVTAAAGAISRSAG